MLASSVILGNKELFAVGKFYEDKLSKICCLLCFMWCMTDIKENKSLTVYNVTKSQCWLHTTLCVVVIIVFVFKRDIDMFTCSVWLFLHCRKLTQLLFLSIGFNTVEMKTSEPDQRLFPRKITELKLSQVIKDTAASVLWLKTFPSILWEINYAQ